MQEDKDNLKLFTTNLERIRKLKKKTENLSYDYHGAMQRIKAHEIDLSCMNKKAVNLENKIDKLIITNK